jgi:hypothetical protein
MHHGVNPTHLKIGDATTVIWCAKPKKNCSNTRKKLITGKAFEEATTTPLKMEEI